MNDSITKTPEEWRNFHVRSPITACRLKHDGLKRLYQIVNEKQKEYRDKIVSGLFRTDKETLEEFQKRKRHVTDAFVTSVTINAMNGEILTGNTEKIFDDINAPTRIRSVLYTTQSVPQAILNHVPLDRITVFLDFSRPPLLDFNRNPASTTPNESNFEIAANNESWFSSTNIKLSEFFVERQTGYEWLHSAGVYDILLLLVGIPLSIWASVKVSVIFPHIQQLDTLPRSISYTYAFILMLYTFRLLFSYSRWVFPKVEIESDIRKSPLRHRAIWGFILIAVTGPAMYELCRAVITYLASL
ncbi:MAG TPA: hypothetical protein VKS60_11095 [Stellaceae bacterium]|nr:hypothetical protein [Stellaceae bacterium]